MIIEIALGIVLAVVILAYLPVIISVGAVLLVIAAVSLVVVIFWQKLATIAGGIGAIALLFGLPLYLKGALPKRYPRLTQLLAFESINSLAAHPGRSALGLLTGFCIALSGVASLFVVVRILEHFGILK